MERHINGFGLSEEYYKVGRRFRNMISDLWQFVVYGTGKNMVKLYLHGYLHNIK